MEHASCSRLERWRIAAATECASVESAKLLPGFHCQMSIRSGVRELVAAYERIRLNSWQPCVRLDHLAELMASGHVDERLRVVEPAAAMP